MNNIDFLNGQAAKLLAPEFHALGHYDIKPWTPVDTMAILKLLNFHLSWNWNQDLMRELLSKMYLDDMIEDIFPFTAEGSFNMVTIIDDEDLVGTKFWSDETLTERYHKSKGTKPILTKA